MTGHDRKFDALLRRFQSQSLLHCHHALTLSGFTHKITVLTRTKGFVSTRTLFTSTMFDLTSTASESSWHCYKSFNYVFKFGCVIELESMWESLKLRSRICSRTSDTFLLIANITSRILSGIRRRRLGLQEQRTTFASHEKFVERLGQAKSSKHRCHRERNSR